MNSRLLVIAAFAAATAPSISSASPEKSSLEACANAFASAVGNATGPAPGYKLTYRGGIGSSFADYYSSQYTFNMDARDPKSGAVIAHAVCTADSRGVTAFHTTAVEGKTTKLASSN